MSRAATATKERGIIFSAPMVKAILAGRKTQTRRVVKLPIPWSFPPAMFDKKACAINRYGCDPSERIACPYGNPGERLWVRETWEYADHSTLTNPAALYRADMKMDECEVAWKWRSPIHMPRRLSRITLEIESVRVELVQDISHRDALAEGVAYDVSKTDGAPLPRFRALWDDIHGRDSWDANPWVWVLTFRRIDAPEQPAIRAGGSHA